MTTIWLLSVFCGYLNVGGFTSDLVCSETFLNFVLLKIYFFAGAFCSRTPGRPSQPPVHHRIGPHARLSTLVLSLYTTVFSVKKIPYFSFSSFRRGSARAQFKGARIPLSLIRPSKTIKHASPQGTPTNLAIELYPFGSP